MKSAESATDVGLKLSPDVVDSTGTSDLGPSLETLQDLVAAFSAQRDSLLDKLRIKLEQLKEVCLQESVSQAAPTFYSCLLFLVDPLVSSGFVGYLKKVFKKRKGALCTKFALAGLGLSGSTSLKRGPISESEGKKGHCKSRAFFSLKGKSAD